MAGPQTVLHYTPNGNFSATGSYLPGADGFNLADVSSVAQVNALPAGVRGLVWLGATSGATQDFINQVTPFIGNPNVYGFYLADEADPSSVSAADLQAEADWIHQNDPGAKTFIIEYNTGTPTAPIYAFTPANTDIDLFGLDPYPVRPASEGSAFATGVNDSIINASVAAAEAIGVPLSAIVPVYQAFGGGGYSSWTLPTAAQEQQILTTWGSLVPAPAFDYAYSWGTQSNDSAISNTSALQAVFAAHNGVAQMVGSPTISATIMLTATDSLGDTQTVPVITAGTLAFTGTLAGTVNQRIAAGVDTIAATGSIANETLTFTAGNASLGLPGGPTVTLTGGDLVTGPQTVLHYTPNGNFSATGSYLPGADGFNLADISSVAQVNALPAGVKGLVWLGATSGATQDFINQVTPFIGNPSVYGFYLADEPDPSSVSAANLKAETDWIHQNDPGAMTFIIEANTGIIEANTGIPMVPSYAFTPANTGIDLFGLAPYPVGSASNGGTGIDDTVINASVAAAEAAGIPQSAIVPVYQASGNGNSSGISPTASQEQQILGAWGSLVPTPAFDFADSWGTQNGNSAISNTPASQAVFAAHNGVTLPSGRGSIISTIATLTVTDSLGDTQTVPVITAGTLTFTGTLAGTVNQVVTAGVDTISTTGSITNETFTFSAGTFSAGTFSAGTFTAGSAVISFPGGQPVTVTGGGIVSGPETALHYAPGGNFSATGSYLPGADGFNLADVSSVAQVNALPVGVRGLVWLGATSGATRDFINQVTPFIGNPNVYGFYLADEPDPSSVSAANLKAETDWIHQNDPGAMTFIVEHNSRTPTAPIYAFTPANTGIDLFGLNPYPAGSASTVAVGVANLFINASVAAAEAAGIPQSAIVPVYPASDGGTAGSALPTASQEQRILATWGTLVPTPAFDFADSWGVRNGASAISNTPASQAFFAARNGVAQMTGSPTVSATITLTATDSLGDTLTVPVITSDAMAFTGTLAGTVNQLVTAGVDTISTIGSITNEALTFTTGNANIRFLGGQSVTVTGGSGNDIVTAAAGANLFIAGGGTLDVTGGTGPDAYMFLAGSGLLKIEDFSAAKGDTLTVDPSLRSSLTAGSDGLGGTLLSFGTSGQGIDIVNTPGFPVSAIGFG